LHEEVARRMQERLEWIRLHPQAWAHWEPVRGGLAAQPLLAGRYPQAQCLLVEDQPARARHAARALVPAWWRRWRTPAPQVVDAVPDGGVQMLWANMALHLAADPQALIGRWHRALATDGFLMFSCLGPDTARELRDMYQALGWPAANVRIYDDLRDVFDGVKKFGSLFLVRNERINKKSILFRMNRFVERLVCVKLPCLWNRYFDTEVSLQVFHHDTI
jgi:SAM-dependent methyltransferase